MTGPVERRQNFPELKRERLVETLYDGDPASKIPIQDMVRSELAKALTDPEYAAPEWMDGILECGALVGCSISGVPKEQAAMLILNGNEELETLPIHDIVGRLAEAAQYHGITRNGFTNDLARINSAGMADKLPVGFTFRCMLDAFSAGANHFEHSDQSIAAFFLTFSHQLALQPIVTTQNGIVT